MQTNVEWLDAWAQSSKKKRFFLQHQVSKMTVRKASMTRAGARDAGYKGLQTCLFKAVLGRLTRESATAGVRSRVESQQ